MLHINVARCVLKRTASEKIVCCAWVLFQNEAMTGTHTQNPVYSRITLALMEDTGWYRANYSMAQPLSWGKDFGCDFAMKSCKEWMDNKTLR
jgi:leishmanolysin-like peptidase